MKYKAFAAFAAGVMLAATSLAGCAGVEAEHAKHEHDWGEWRETPPTCTAAGKRERVCKTDPSHVETQEIPALGHEWSKEWTREENGHYHVCDRGCGERVMEAPHTFVRGACSVCFVR